ncbi:MAG: ribonuclease P protein component [Dehalococcoidia bacterium]
MGRGHRLTQGKRIAQLLHEGQGWTNRVLVLRVLPSGLETSRVGFLVGKRLGKAVVRNRIRRRLREVARLTSIKVGWDLVIIARQGAPAASYHRLRMALLDLLQRAQLLDFDGEEASV